jgi:hypothetical protein
LGAIFGVLLFFLVFIRTFQPLDAGIERRAIANFAVVSKRVQKCKIRRAVQNDNGVGP